VRGQEFPDYNTTASELKNHDDGRNGYVNIYQKCVTSFMSFPLPPAARRIPPMARTPEVLKVA